MMNSRTTPHSRRCFQRYNALLCPLLPPLAVYTLWRRFGQGRSPESLRGQWGNVPEDAVKAMQSDFGTRIWIHGVSVGEAMAARPVARAFREALPDSKIGLSVTTDTGFETAQAAVNSGDMDAAWYFPLDAAMPVRRALHSIQPHVVLLMETELWPNFLHLSRTFGAQTFLVNGRVSDNMLSTPNKLGKLKLGWVWHWMMQNLDGLLMRSQFDAQRILNLGAPPDCVQITGDVKLDSTPPDEQTDVQRKHWREVLQIEPDALVWVAGSTHPGEEEIVLQAYSKAREQFPNLRLVLAPRHLERLNEVLSVLQTSNFPFVQRTKMEKNNNLSTLPVIILDTVGELSSVYRAADVAFVGGSLIPRGGHNVLEPPLVGVPVLFGPHTANFHEAAALVQENSLGEMVADEAKLYEALQNWLSDAQRRKTTKLKAREALAPHRGAASRVAAIIAANLSHGTTDAHR